MKKRSLIIILNPIADNGNANKKMPLIKDFFSKKEVDFKIITTEGVGHAISIASSFSPDPDQVIVAAGGDGTSNEVINGLMANKILNTSASSLQNSSNFGVLPIGRGNDFAYGAGIPADFTESMNLLLEGDLYPIDIGFVIGGDYPQGRYFGNGVGIGFDTIVGLEAAKMKYLHGTASYIVAALKTLIMNPKAPTIEISYHGKKRTITPALTSIMNGKRMGGSFFMAPEGDMNDGLFNLTITEQVSRTSELKAMLLYMKGEQRKHQDTMMDSADRILLEAISGGMTVHADGETICIDGKALEIKIVPSALHLISVRK